MEYRLLSEGGAYFWNKTPPLKHGLKIKTGGGVCNADGRVAWTHASIGKILENHKALRRQRDWTNGMPPW